MARLSDTHGWLTGVPARMETVPSRRSKRDGPGVGVYRSTWTSVGIGLTRDIAVVAKQGGVLEKVDSGGCRGLVGGTHIEFWP